MSYEYFLEFFEGTQAFMAVDTSVNSVMNNSSFLDSNTYQIFSKLHEWLLNMDFDLQAFLLTCLPALYDKDLFLNFLDNNVILEWFIETSFNNNIFLDSQFSEASTLFINFSLLEHGSIFNDIFNIVDNTFLFESLFSIAFLTIFSKIFFFESTDELTNEILIRQEFMKLKEPLFYNNVENVQSIYHHSIPTVKMYYPEPFIASPSFLHNDIWYMHILIYWYWLWFIFIFLIVFFFIVFLCSSRWCNNRNKPRRETRGVSRSKCGDIITATVPVTWAISIIISESADSIDYFDGFKTTELIIGIRAYQWGWEYYYPKDVDLNYNLKPSYNTMLGNSLKYSLESDMKLKKNNFLNFYKNKKNDSPLLPINTILLPISKNDLINSINFKNFGKHNSVLSNSFKKINTYNKFSKFNLFQGNNLNYLNNYQQFLITSYTNSCNFVYSNNFKILKKFNLLSIQMYQNNFSSLFDLRALNQFLFKNKLVQRTDFISSMKLDLNISTNIFSTGINTEEDNMNLNFKKWLNSTLLFDFFNNSTQSKLKNNTFTLFFKNKTNNNIIYQNLSQALAFNQYEYKTNSAAKLNFFSFKKNKLFKIYSNVSKFNFFSNDDYLLSNKVNKKWLLNYNQRNNLSVFNNLYNLNLVASSYNNLLELKNFNFNFNSKLNLPKNYTKNFSPILTNNKLFWPQDIRLNIIKGSDDQLYSSTVPSSLYKNYFIESNFFLKNINQKLLNIINLNSFYLYQNIPNIFYYSDYDFLNKASILFIDSFIWDSYSHDTVIDEYFSLNNFKTTLFKLKLNFFLNKLDSLDMIVDENVINFETLFVVYKSFYKGFFTKYIKFSNTFSKTYTIFAPTNSINTQHLINYNLNYFYINKFINDDQENSYDYKKSHQIFFNNYTNILFYSINNLIKSYSFISYINSYTTILNELNWVAPVVPFINENNLTTFLKLSKTSSINLRMNATNLLADYKSLQKVFKLRFDDLRAFSNISFLSNSFKKQLDLSSSNVSYDKVLLKNKQSYFNINLYNFKILPSNLTYTYFLNSLNTYTFDFPFLLSLQSDQARYIWFDWFSKWVKYEMQQASLSKFGLYGLPKFDKSFEYGTLNAKFLDTEHYMSRLLTIRKNYFLTNKFSPFLYKRIKFYNINLATFYINLNEKNNLFRVHFITNIFKTTINSTRPVQFTNYFFNNLMSGTTKYGKAYFNCYYPSSSLYENINNLSDILTKREFLYRQLYLTNYYRIFLPNSFSANPNNFFFNELKSIYNFNNINKTLFNNIYINDDYLNYLYYTSPSNLIIQKNQYKQIRRGISNMVRIQASNMIALPTEIRIQLLASSRDIIHSWAIPSAGIKIDCVPGYSSHKILFFLLSGIYWGQCMEICGRYHHWMPIIVYFMKRDLFFLWCTHFVLTDKNSYISSSTTNLIYSSQKPVSYNKIAWLNQNL